MPYESRLPPPMTITTTVTANLKICLVLQKRYSLSQRLCGSYCSHVNSPVFLEYGMIVMLISIVVNYFVSHKMMAVAKQTGSPALETDALHLQTDIWTSGGILVSLLFLQVTGWSWIDPTIAIMVAIVILKSGYSMIKKNISELTDISLPKAEEQLISEIISHHDQVISVCQLRTRYSGSYRLIDMSLVLDKNMQLDKAHAICDQLEAKIKHHFGICDVMIHLEPDKTNESPLISNR